MPVAPAMTKTMAAILLPTDKDESGEIQNVADRDIILASPLMKGGDYNGVDWLLKNHRDLIDAEYALNEGGGGAEMDGKK